MGWNNYDVPNGPIGERIFKIAVCPVDGDVWMGTSAGLTRYSVSKDEWTHYTKGQTKNPSAPPHVDAYYKTNAAGLPGDQVNALAFDARGIFSRARNAMASRCPAGHRITTTGGRCP